MSRTSPATPPARVARVMDAYPPAIRKKIQAVRKLILQVAAQTEGVGMLTETLKWGEPAYLTEASRSGTTIRVAWKASKPDQFGIYVNCQTTLIGTFRRLYADDLMFEGNRAIMFDAKKPLPLVIMRDCIGKALTYHRDK